MNSIVTKFLEIKIDMYKAKNTYINYNIDLGQLDIHMTRKLGNDWIKNITSDDMELYIKHLKDKGYNLSSINRKIASASKFFSYCVNKDLIRKNPMVNIELFELPAKVRKSLSVDDIRKIIDCTYKREAREKNYKFISTRNRFILALLTTTGLRVGELMNISVSKLEKIDGGYMINISSSETKNKVNKRVPIANKTLLYFNEYIEERKKCGFHHKDVLILSRTGKKMTRTGIAKMMSKYAKRVGMEDINITPHKFRHACTGILRKNKVEDSLIYNILGWKEGIMSVYTDDITSLDMLKIESCNIL